MSRKKAGTHGGKREGAGRPHSPWRKMDLAERYAELKAAYRFADFVAANPAAAGDPRVKRHLRPGIEGRFPNPVYRALLALHAELHPADGVDIETTRKLVRRGRSWDILLAELSAEQDPQRRGQMIDDAGLSRKVSKFGGTIWISRRSRKS